MSTVAVVPAAGTGSRLALGSPKAFVVLGGVPLIVRCVRGLLASAVVDHVVVATPPALVTGAVELLSGVNGVQRHLVSVVAGGVDRRESVGLALRQLLADRAMPEIILVHDAARPLTPPELFGEVVAAVRAGWPAVVPALPLADTVKRLDPSGRVLATIDRSVLCGVQTPQGFAADVLLRAYRLADGSERCDGGVGLVTDDAGMVEALGEPVFTVPGHPMAFKITTAWDLALAELLVASR